MVADGALCPDVVAAALARCDELVAITRRAGYGPFATAQQPEERRSGGALKEGAA
jgi:hypothetical protein